MALEVGWESLRSADRRIRYDVLQVLRGFNLPDERDAPFGDSPLFFNAVVDTFVPNCGQSYPHFRILGYLLSVPGPHPGCSFWVRHVEVDDVTVLEVQALPVSRCQKQQACGQTPRVPPRRSEATVICFLAFMGIITSFGVDSALPAFDEIRPDVGLDPGSNRITLLVTFYVVGAAVGQVLCGPFVDRFGRIPVLQSGLALYVVGVISTIVSPNMTLLLVGRVVWGLGASVPASIRAAIARDLYSGDRMAQVLAWTMGVFLAGPIVTPLVAEAVLAVGSWRMVFGLGLVLAGVASWWSLRFGETLQPGNRRPLSWHSSSQALRAIFTTRTTVGYLLAMAFGQGAFLIWLGSSQPVFDLIFRRADHFAFFFSAAGVMQAIGFFTVNRFIVRHGAHRVAIFSVGVAVAISTLQLVISLGTGGVPAFGVWFTLMAVTNTALWQLMPTGIALALEPMGTLAGTASGILGASSVAGGAVLAALIDAQISTSTTPMAVGYLLYGTGALVAALWARPGSLGKS